MTAAESIVREHGARIRKLLSTFKGLTPAERQDVFSRVSLKLVEQAHTFENRSAVTTWLHRVVVNDVLMLVRKASYKREQGGHDNESLEHASEAAHAREPSPESQLNRAQTLHRSLELLTREDRELLTRHYLEGVPLKELGKELGLEEKAMKSRLFRARAKARDSYEGKRHVKGAHNRVGRAEARSAEPLASRLSPQTARRNIA